MFKNIILKGTLLLAPLIIYFSTPAIVLLFSGELKSLESVVDEQIKNPETIYGTVFHWAVVNYKIEFIKHIKPQLIILGSSRVMQFRENFFKNILVYNAGGVVQKMLDYMDFLKVLETKCKPEVLFIGLDQYYFNSKYDPIVYNDRFIDNQLGIKAPNLLQELAENHKRIYADLFNGKILFSNLFQHKNPTNKNYSSIGLFAKMKGDGFRSDGSHFYSSLIKDPFKKDAEDEDATFSDTLKRIKNGENKFSFGDTVSDKALTEVDKLLNYCSLNNIKVVAFLPPFASKTYNAMINSGKHTYVLKIYSELAPIFSKYKDMELYDYSNIEWYGSSDLETVDGFHGSENSYGKLIMDIASKSKFLENYVNITLIKDKIENTKNPYYLFI